MVFFIYQLGSLASVWAISNLIKKDYRSVTSNKLDWCFWIFFHFEKQD